MNHPPNLRKSGNTTRVSMSYRNFYLTGRLTMLYVGRAAIQGTPIEDGKIFNSTSILSS
uniref:Uncharacterized protein n=1 Tax=Anopheles atroparvus TaxID=41427 RepID=A0AAG5DQV0_ANOAO